MDLISFQLYDAVTNLPDPTATPTFLHYKDRTGAARTPPTIVHVANGVFAFSPTDADVTIGVAWVVAGGAGVYPVRYFGSIAPPDQPFLTCVFENGVGALTDISATPPTLSFYKTRLGVDVLPQPTPVNVFGGYLWTISPTAVDSLAGVVFDVAAPAGAFPAHFAGDLLAQTPSSVVTNVFVSNFTPTISRVITPVAVSSLLPSEAMGIHQSDVIIRTALTHALADLRANPWLLDYVFASLPRDERTAKDYGEKSVSRAKDWFLKTDIPVSMVPRIDEGRWPRITISLADSQETENTFSDIHYEPVQYIASGNWPALTRKFTPVSYEPQTGEVVLPTSITDNLNVVAGMHIIDRSGREHEIVDEDMNSIFIGAGTIVDLTDAVIKGVRPMLAVHMESAAFKETYHIGIHVGGEPVYLTWLHSIISFALLRYRQAFLEARGFERSSITSSDFSKNDTFEGELVFSRYITCSGVVRNYWPKSVNNTINSIDGRIRVNPAGQLPISRDDVNKDDGLWIGQDDILDRDGIG